MTGWNLSDDTNNLTQWSFSETTIAAGDYLVVFASGQATEASDFEYTTTRTNGFALSE